MCDMGVVFLETFRYSFELYRFKTDPKVCILVPQKVLNVL
jgi:hypothetical protein